MKKTTSSAILIILILSVFYWYKTSNQNNKALDYKNATYIIDKQNIKLKDGLSKTEIALNSASKMITKYFGNEVEGDFNKDGYKDVAFLLTQSAGGSGTFYYVAVALNTHSGYRGINAVFLGDRIAPQTTEYRNGEIIVNYATRKDTEPMTASPSLGVSKYFKVENSLLVEIIK